MALARVKTWSSGEILTASDLNAEFDSILNNARDLVSPLTASLDLNGVELILDADADTSVTADTDDQIDFRISGTDVIVWTAATLAFNEQGADINFRVESDTNANALFIDAGLFTGVGAIGLAAAATDAAVVLIDNPALTATANTNIAKLRLENTAAITVPAGTTAIAASLSVDEPNLTATGTITVAATVYIEAAPTEGGSNYALWVDSGNARFDGDILFVDNTTDIGASGATRPRDLFLARNAAIGGDATVVGAVSAATVSGAAVATQANMETGTATNLIVPPGRQHFHPGHPKFWLNCGVTGTIDASYNITSITDTGTGDLAVTIATDFSSVNYAVVSGVEGGALHIGVTATTQAAGTFSLEVRDTAGTLVDPTSYYVIGCGDQA